MVQVLPLLNLPSGEVELTPFKIGVKHPVRNVMELCLNLSSNDAVLPVLIALMVHCERENGREQFQVGSCLVGYDCMVYWSQDFWRYNQVPMTNYDVLNGPLVLVHIATASHIQLYSQT